MFRSGMSFKVHASISRFIYLAAKRSKCISYMTSSQCGRCHFEEAGFCVWLKDLYEIDPIRGRFLTFRYHTVAIESRFHEPRFSILKINPAAKRSITTLPPTLSMLQRHACLIAKLRFGTKNCGFVKNAMSPGLRRFRVTSPLDQQRLSICKLNPAAKRTIFLRHPTLSMLRRHATISKILLPLVKYVQFHSGRSLALHHCETIFDRFGAGFI